MSRSDMLRTNGLRTRGGYRLCPPKNLKIMTPWTGARSHPDESEFDATRWSMETIVIALSLIMVLSYQSPDDGNSWSTIRADVREDCSVRRGLGHMHGVPAAAIMTIASTEKLTLATRTRSRQPENHIKEPWEVTSTVA